MNEIILCALFGVFILFSFITGLSFGCKLRNDETIKIPNLNPVKVIKDHKEERKQKEREEYGIEYDESDESDELDDW